MSYKKSLGTKEVSVEIGPLASAALPSPPKSISPSQRAEAEREFQLGERSYWCFDDGEDLESLEDAVKHYQRSRELGHAGALGVLGRITIYGEEGVERDEKAGFVMVEGSVQQGHVAGKLALASCYYWGRGGQEKNREKAFEAYTSAAEQLYPPAVEDLGVCYLYGHGVEKNQTKAVELLLKASELGMPQRKNSLLAQCYTKGEGVAKDEAEADAWNAKAEKQWRRRVKARNGWVLEPFDPVQSANVRSAATGYIGTLPEDIWAAWVIAYLFCDKKEYRWLGGWAVATALVQAAFIGFVWYDIWPQYKATLYTDQIITIRIACSIVALVVFTVALSPDIRNLIKLINFVDQIGELPSDPQVEEATIRIERLHNPTTGVEGVTPVAANREIPTIATIIISFRLLADSGLLLAAFSSLAFRTPETIGEIVLNTVGFVFISEIDDLAYGVFVSARVKHMVQTLVWYDRSVCEKNINQMKHGSSTKSLLWRVVPILVVGGALMGLFIPAFLGSTIIAPAGGEDSFVGGGYNNTASGISSIVVGGAGNVASREYAFVGGGYNNTASGISSIVVGGFGNVASGQDSFVGGGYNNTASGISSIVVGGFGNVASGGESFAGGGAGNVASREYAFVGGGYKNTASGAWSTVSGGISNVASGETSIYNIVSSDEALTIVASVVGGGQENRASGLQSVVGGGYNNTASGDWTTVSGGFQNTASSLESVVGGGYNNTAYGNWSTVSGGIHNTAERNSTVGGGDSNVASGFGSIVGGGRLNTASGRLATVSGGDKNTASGEESFVGGGYNNTASGSFAAVSGGSSNVASGTASVASGFANIAGGNYSLAVGFNATTSSDHSAVLGFQATGACPSNGPNTLTVCAPNGFFVNGVELGSGRRLLSEDVADAGVDAAQDREIGALRRENVALKREIDTLKQEMANIVRLLSQSGSRALVTP